MTDIAQRAQVALGTLYRYFPSKELLYASALQKWSLNGRFLLPFPGLDAEDRIRARVTAVIDAFEADLQFVKTINLLYSTRDEEVQAVLAEMTRTGTEILLDDLTTIGTDARGRRLHALGRHQLTSHRRNPPQRQLPRDPPSSKSSSP